jgi:hypothetical protein
MNDEKIPALDHGSDFAEAESPGIEYISRPVSGAERDLGKANAAKEACLLGDREAIAKLAISKDGLLNDKIRRKACMYFSDSFTFAQEAGLLILYKL